MNTSRIFSQDEIKKAISLTCKKGTRVFTDEQKKKHKTKLGLFCGDVQKRESLVGSILTDTYKPQWYFGMPKPRPGKDPRIILVPCPEDRAIYRAIFEKIKPFFQDLSAFPVFGYSHASGSADLKRGVKQALQHSAKHATRHAWYVKIDIKNFFPSIPRKRLLKRLKKIGVDSDLLELIAFAISRKVTVHPQLRRFLPRDGIPQGCSFSPLLANFYALPFEKSLDQEATPSTRYLDDMIVFCDTKSQARELLTLLNNTAEKLGLQIHELTQDKSKTYIGQTAVGFEYLGVFVDKAGDFSISNEAIQKAADRIYEKHFGSQENEYDSTKSINAWSGFPKHLGLKTGQYEKKLRLALKHKNKCHSNGNA